MLKAKRPTGRRLSQFRNGVSHWAGMMELRIQGRSKFIFRRKGSTDRGKKQTDFARVVCKEEESHWRTMWRFELDCGEEGHDRVSGRLHQRSGLSFMAVSWKYLKSQTGIQMRSQGVS